MADAEVDYLIRLPEVEKQVGLKRSSIYRRMAEQTFPQALDLGGGQVRWRQSAITGWLNGLEQRKLCNPPPMAITQGRR